MVHHELAGGEYNARREACEEGVRILRPYLGPITALRDVTPKELDRHRRAPARARLSPLPPHRHRERPRAVEAERALKAGDFAACGKAMNASHASMRDDFEISCPEIDFLADFARRDRRASTARA